MVYDYGVVYVNVQLCDLIGVVQGGVGYDYFGYCYWVQVCYGCGCIGVFDLDFDGFYGCGLFLCWEFVCDCLVWCVGDEVYLFLFGVVIEFVDYVVDVEGKFVVVFVDVMVVCQQVFVFFYYLVQVVDWEVLCVQLCQCG